jgi:hypothetical protein
MRHGLEKQKIMRKLKYIRIVNFKIELSDIHLIYDLIKFTRKYKKIKIKIKIFTVFQLKLTFMYDILNASIHECRIF